MANERDERAQGRRVGQKDAERMPQNSTNSKDSTNSAAAVRHMVYRDLVDYLPVASREQTLLMMSNLRLRSELRRFLGLRVSIGLAETNYRGATLKEIETWLNRRYGDQLATVPGFYRREGGPFRVNLPQGCAIHAYRSGGIIRGLLCQPLDRSKTFFLLSSAKYGGPRASQLTPADQVYFTQFQECTI